MTQGRLRQFATRTPSKKSLFPLGACTRLSFCFGSKGPVELCEQGYRKKLEKQLQEKRLPTSCALKVFVCFASTLTSCKAKQGPIVLLLL